MKKLRQVIKEQKKNQLASINFDDKYKLIKSKKGKVRDVLFLFGQWVGHRLSDIMQDPQGQNYIFNYVLNPKNNFPPDFKKIVYEIAKSYESEDDYYTLKETDDIPF